MSRRSTVGKPDVAGGHLVVLLPTRMVIQDSYLSRHSGFVHQRTRSHTRRYNFLALSVFTLACIMPYFMAFVSFNFCFRPFLFLVHFFVRIRFHSCLDTVNALALSSSSELCRASSRISLACRFSIVYRVGSTLSHAVCNVLYFVAKFASGFAITVSDIVLPRSVRLATMFWSFAMCCSIESRGAILYLWNFWRRIHFILLKFLFAA